MRNNPNHHEAASHATDNERYFREFHANPKRSRYKPSLRLRVALAFAGLGAVLSLLLSLWLQLASHEAGLRLMDETLKAELEDYRARRQRNPLSLPPATLTLLGYVLPGPAGAAPPPASLLALAPGHHDVEIAGTPYRLLVQEAEGSRYFLLYNETRQAAREADFRWLLASGVLMMTLIASAAGFWLAGRVIAPVTALAARVRELEPEAAPAPLRLDFPTGELGALATAFDRYLGRLRAFIERERAFTADVSHELRTPLAVIQGAAEIEAENPDLSPRQRQRALRIQRAAQEMAEIITALLALAREEAGPMARDQCPLAEVVRNGAERHRHLIAQRPVALVVEVAAEPRVPAERALVRIVVANLIRNALEHTDQGQVLIRLEEGRLLVRDTGRGIAADQLSRLFQRHYKGGASQGEGIGLSLTKRICDRHGWEIEVESEEGRGTEVRLLFNPTSANLNGALT